MAVPATLVWVAPEPPNTEQSRTVSSWASAHGVTLAEPQDERPPTLEVDPHVADEVEELLDRARDAIDARDPIAVDRALDAAEARLRAHAELPQSAWLMAEVDRARSTRWRRIEPTDVEAAERSWLRAEALDRGRVPGVSEHGGAGTPAPATVALAMSRGQRAWLDGVPVLTIPVATRAGLHALVVTWAGAPVWAGWIESPAGSSRVEVEGPEAPPCSSVDLTGVRVDRNAIVADDVRCASWVAVTNGGSPASVRVARCEADRCSPLLEWQAPASRWTRTVPEHGGPARWPSWATWGLVGAGAAVAAGIAIVATGVLAPAPAQTRFVIGSVTTH
jgi:hypothetical protein